MGTDKKTQIRIIKQGIAGSIPESQAVSEERQSVSGWVAQFKGRRRPDPRITFQTLFKEA